MKRETYKELQKLARKFETDRLEKSLSYYEHAYDVRLDINDIEDLSDMEYSNKVAIVCREELIKRNYCDH